MEKTQYFDKVAKTVHYFKNLSLEELLIRQNQVNHFSLASLTLSHFLQSLDVASHENIIKDILTYQHISILGQQYPFTVKDAFLDENVKSKLNDLKSNPHVIATFHFGSYRQINSLLLEHDVPYSLVISSATINQQSKEFLQKSKEYFNKSFTLIDAESPSSAISMIREIKKGNSLLIYLDGNIGAGGNKAKAESLCSIDFLDGHLHVRKGAAYISHIAKVPIFTATSYLENYRDLYFDFGNTIIPGAHTEREDYAVSTMQDLYTHFSTLLRKYPQQWEAWFYLHKNIDKRTKHIPVDGNTENKTGKYGYYPGKSLKFNLENYSLFKGPSDYYVLDKQSFLSYPLEKEAYRILIDCLANKQVKVKKSDTALVDHLVRNSLLTLS